MVPVLSSNNSVIHSKECHSPLSVNLEPIPPVSFHILEGVSTKLLHNKLGFPSKNIAQTILKNKWISSAYNNKQSFEFCDIC